MKELIFSYDKQGKKFVKGDLSFEPVMAGQKEERRFYVKNIIKYDIKVLFIADNIVPRSFVLKPDEVKEVVVRFNEKLTAMKPINQKFGMMLEYFVR